MKNLMGKRVATHGQKGSFTVSEGTHFQFVYDKEPPPKRKSTGRPKGKIGTIREEDIELVEKARSIHQIGGRPKYTAAIIAVCERLEGVKPSKPYQWLRMKREQGNNYDVFLSKVRRIARLAFK